MNINFSELNIDNIGQWPYVVKIALILISMILIIGVGYWFFVAPNFEKLSALEADEKTLRIEFEDKQTKAADLEAYKEQLLQMQARFAAVLKQLPAENEMPGLLEDISKTGVATGLKFALFAPQTPIMHDFYVELPIKIRVTGNYNQLAIFLSRIAELSRIVTLHDFVIEWEPTPAGSATGSTPAKKILAMEITARIYWYRAQ